MLFLLDDGLVFYWVYECFEIDGIWVSFFFFHNFKFIHGILITITSLLAKVALLLNGCGLSSFVLCVISWSSGSINKILLSFVCQHHIISYTLSISDWIWVTNEAHMCRTLLSFCIAIFQGFICCLFTGIDW